MADAPENYHIDYPSTIFELPVRELLHRSQTDVTSDPTEGVQYATAAYHKSSLPQEQDAHPDPTAMGEAAAKVAFRGHQAGMPAEGVTYWFEASRQALSNDDERTKRELLATLHLAGRVIGHEAGSNQVDRTADPELTHQASSYFQEAMGIAYGQHTLGERWDPYAPMLAKSYAAHEALSGRAKIAAIVALKGLHMALYSRPETTNQPELSNEEKKSQHRRFVAKQAGLNAVALALAATRPLADRSERFDRPHRRTALRILG